MNARTYNRDSRLAFRNHCDYACAIERPTRTYPRTVWIAIVAGIAAALVAARFT